VGAEARTFRTHASDSVEGVTEPERCAECGFDSTHLTVPDAVAALRSMGRRWDALFEGVPDEALRRRPAPEVWSPLEYAAHTRDILGLFAVGLPPVLAGAHPNYPVATDEPAGADHGYNSLDPRAVLGELADRAGQLAGEAEAVKNPADWERTATLGDHDRDARWLLFHALHDASHHLRDVEKQVGGE